MLKILLAAIMAMSLMACDGGGSDQRQPGQPFGEVVPLRHAKMFFMEERDGLTLVRVSASLRSWSAGGTSSRQSMSILLVPRDRDVPALSGDLSDAIVVRTPVSRLAVNSQVEEAFLEQLGVLDRLVAVGGTRSFNDLVRGRVKAKEIGQVGYSWHSPPNLDVLLASRPDVFVMRLSNLEHAEHLRRANALGVPTIPYFVDAEPTYLGRAEWIRFFGALTGKSREADQLFARIEQRVAQLKQAAEKQPKTTVVWADPQGRDKWSAVVRSAQASFIDDAGGLNMLREQDAPDKDHFREIGTETLLARGRDADCWIVGDIHGAPLQNRSVPERMRAWQRGCLFATDGRSKPEVDAYDWYQGSIVRPDLVLEDFIAMLHPKLASRPPIYLRRLSKEAV